MQIARIFPFLLLLTWRYLLHLGRVWIIALSTTMDNDAFMGNNFLATRVTRRIL